MTLTEKQQLFSQMIVLLISEAINMGFEVTLGEAWRSPETAELYAKENKGIVNSLHCQRLAIDLNLFKNGQFLDKTEDYSKLGTWWENQSTSQIKCCWGGRFERTDADHFSFEHNGIR